MGRIRLCADARCLLLLIALALTCGPSLAVQGEAPATVRFVEAGFNGLVASDSLVTAMLEVTAPRPAILEVSLRGSRDSTVGGQVAVVPLDASSAPRLVEIPFTRPATLGEDRISWRLREAGRVVLAAEKGLEPIRNRGYLLHIASGECSEPAMSPTALHRVVRPPNSTPDHLRDLQPCYIIVISEADFAGLAPGSQRALLNRANLGGLLVIESATEPPVAVVPALAGLAAPEALTWQHEGQVLREIAFGAGCVRSMTLDACTASSQWSTALEALVMSTETRWAMSPWLGSRWLNVEAAWHGERGPALAVDPLGAHLRLVGRTRSAALLAAAAALVAPILLLLAVSARGRPASGGFVVAAGIFVLSLPFASFLLLRSLHVAPLQVVTSASFHDAVTGLDRRVISTAITALATLQEPRASYDADPDRIVTVLSNWSRLTHEGGQRWRAQSHHRFGAGEVTQHVVETDSSEGLPSWQVNLRWSAGRAVGTVVPRRDFAHALAVMPPRAWRLGSIPAGTPIDLGAVFEQPAIRAEDPEVTDEEWIALRQFFIGEWMGIAQYRQYRRADVVWHRSGFGTPPVDLVLLGLPAGAASWGEASSRMALVAQSIIMANPADGPEAGGTATAMVLGHTDGSTEHVTLVLSDSVLGRSGGRPWFSLGRVQADLSEPESCGIPGFSCVTLPGQAFRPEARQALVAYRPAEVHP